MILFDDQISPLLSSLVVDDKTMFYKFAQAINAKAAATGVEVNWDFNEFCDVCEIPKSSLAKDSPLFLLFWVYFFMVTKYYMRNEFTFKYSDVDEFIDEYSPKFDHYLEKYKKLLMETANWMSYLFAMVPAKKNKGLAMTVIPKLLEGLSVKYITGSGQTTATSDRVTIYEREGCIVPYQRKRKNLIEDFDEDGLPIKRKPAYTYVKKIKTPEQLERAEKRKQKLLKKQERDQAHLLKYPRSSVLAGSNSNLRSPTNVSPDDKVAAECLTLLRSSSNPDLTRSFEVPSSHKRTSGLTDTNLDSGLTEDAAALVLMAASKPTLSRDFVSMPNLQAAMSTTDSLPLTEPLSGGSNVNANVNRLRSRRHQREKFDVIASDKFDVISMPMPEHAAIARTWPPLRKLDELCENKFFGVDELLLSFGNGDQPNTADTTFIRNGGTNMITDSLSASPLLNSNFMHYSMGVGTSTDIAARALRKELLKNIIVDDQLLPLPAVGMPPKPSSELSVLDAIPIPRGASVSVIEGGCAIADALVGPPGSSAKWSESSKESGAASCGTSTSTTSALPVVTLVNDTMVRDSALPTPIMVSDYHAISCAEDLLSLKSTMGVA